MMLCRYWLVIFSHCGKIVGNTVELNLELLALGIGINNKPMGLFLKFQKKAHELLPSKYCNQTHIQSRLYQRQKWYFLNNDKLICTQNLMFYLNVFTELRYSDANFFVPWPWPSRSRSTNPIPLASRAPSASLSILKFMLVL